MSVKKDFLIVGGGLAGLTAAIHLLKAGVPVTIIEKNSYPQHKVCGEYISNEVLPYLNMLGVTLDQLPVTQLRRFQFSPSQGRQILTDLPLGGIGISRYLLDECLYQHALALGCQVIQDKVTHISYASNAFHVELAHHAPLTASLVIAAHGKRDQLDERLSRPFFYKRSPWLAVKAHYKVAFPDDLIGLYTFNGGYCGVSKVENDVVNICYLTSYSSFRKYKNIKEHRAAILYENPQLREIFEKATMINEQPLTISQISFLNKRKVEQHVLMIGDSGGLIHPLCGNGMAMAIHSAKLCAETVISYHSGTMSRAQMEKRYTSLWKQHFGKRMLMGRILSTLLHQQRLTATLTRFLSVFPSVLRFIIRQTHGKKPIFTG
ncbi:possible oxidoreductase [Pedobacter sp. BAL39]|uniref:NAD(P)/FAD-dependent oxidoreductase n=1 Tax=Pedobacter sp. BAL39 TaxID=391596 RepID=UPI00015591ED|nr:NAD(P)/FAD-dependent oxidoreductase [Pedobacter sp. BAL39]EDM36628.1 possible oxidoreductase [Pedobacter sp. BAL39]